MKKVEKFLLAPAVLLVSQAHAAVDVTGFTIAEATRPYGLIAMTIILAGIGLAWLRPSS